MTKKHFEAIAASIAREVAASPESHKHTIRMVASALAVEFASINPRFDRERFMVACNVR